MLYIKSLQKNNKIWTSELRKLFDDEVKDEQWGLLIYSKSLISVIFNSIRVIIKNI